MLAHPRLKKPLLPVPRRKRKVAHRIEEVAFDEEDRTEYLTGFHKRKLARKKHAQDVAEKRAREEKIEMRKQRRESSRKAVEEHVQNVSRMLREAQQAGLGEEGARESGSEDEWDGLSEDAAPEKPLNREEEYVDEDRFTTVTIEAVSVDREGLHGAQTESIAEEEGDVEEDRSVPSDSKNKTVTESANQRAKKKRKFRYETKIERQKVESKRKAKRLSERLSR